MTHTGAKDSMMPAFQQAVFVLCSLGKRLRSDTSFPILRDFLQTLLLQLLPVILQIPAKERRSVQSVRTFGSALTAVKAVFDLFHICLMSFVHIDGSRRAAYHQRHAGAVVYLDSHRTRHTVTAAAAEFSCKLASLFCDECLHFFIQDRRVFVAVEEPVQFFRSLNSPDWQYIVIPGDKGIGSIRSRDQTAAHGLHGDETVWQKKVQFLDADLLVVDESSMMDMSLAYQLFRRLRPNTRVLFVGDADQLESVGPGDVFHQFIKCGLIPVTVLDEIFRQAKDSPIPYNAKYIHDGVTDLCYHKDYFNFSQVNSQEEAADYICSLYLKEIHGSEG